MIRYGSLFSGAGLWDLALERSIPSLRPMFQCEIDRDARAILDAHWPSVPKIKDIADARGADLPAVDGLVGGIPCDMWSTVNTSGNTRDFAHGPGAHAIRLVDELRPSWTLWESSAKDQRWRCWVPPMRRGLWTRGHASVSFRVRTRGLGASHDRHRAFVVSWPRVADTDKQGQPLRAVHAALGSLRATPCSVWDGYVGPRFRICRDDGLDARLARRIGKGVDARTGAATARVLGSLIRVLESGDGMRVGAPQVGMDMEEFDVYCGENYLERIRSTDICAARELMTEQYGLDSGVRVVRAK